MLAGFVIFPNAQAYSFIWIPSLTSVIIVFFSENIRFEERWCNISLGYSGFVIYKGHVGEMDFIEMCPHFGEIDI